VNKGVRLKKRLTLAGTSWVGGNGGIKGERVLFLIETRYHSHIRVNSRRTSQEGASIV
jgi:hypothetical protein